MCNSINQWFEEIGIHKEDNILVHASLRKVKLAFPQITPKEFIERLKNTVSEKGSIIFPTFTYCFKKELQPFEVFHTQNSPSKVGALSEIFRNSSDAIRTSSPTHSFAVWGKISKDYNYLQAPQSPLGKYSVLDWLANSINSYILMLGVNFGSLSFGHYLEIIANVIWKDFSPWNYLNVLPVGVSTLGEQNLIEIPGCAKSFIAFEEHLVNNSMIKKIHFGELASFYIPVEMLMEEGVKYFKQNPNKLLCKKGECLACDARRNAFKINL